MEHGTAAYWFNRLRAQGVHVMMKRYAAKRSYRYSITVWDDNGCATVYKRGQDVARRATPGPWGRGGI